MKPEETSRPLQGRGEFETEEQSQSAARGALITSQKRKIELPGENRLLSDFAGDIGAAIRTADIFRRGDCAWIVNADGTGLAQMTPDTFRTWIEQHVVCYRVRRVSEKGEVVELRKTMSAADAAGVLAATQFISQLRVVDRLNLIRLPIARASGWIEVLPEGYDEASRTFTAAGGIGYAHKVPLAQSRAIIDELLSEFQFADGGRSKAVAIGAMLTVFAAGILPRKSLRPCFVYLANAEGAGKTLLVKCATVPVL